MSVDAIKLSALAGVSYPRVLSFERAGLIVLPDGSGSLSESARQLKVARLEAIRDLRELEFTVEETRQLLKAMEGSDSTVDQSVSDTALRNKVRDHRDQLNEIANRLNQRSSDCLKTG